jgi:hypothetical protein
MPSSPYESAIFCQFGRKSTSLPPKVVKILAQ